MERNNSLMVRLNKIEGQIKGIKKQVDNDVCVEEIVIQVKAIKSALSSFNKTIISEDLINERIIIDESFFKLVSKALG